MKPQVEKTHYDFNKYVSTRRWHSYYRQLYEVSKCKGKNVLLIGKGDGIVANLLENNRKKSYNF